MRKIKNCQEELKIKLQYVLFCMPACHVKIIVTLLSSSVRKILIVNLLILSWYKNFMDNGPWHV